MLRVAMRSRESKDLHRGHGGKAENTEKERKKERFFARIRRLRMTARRQRRRRRAGGTPALRTARQPFESALPVLRVNRPRLAGAIRTREINVVATEA